MSLDIRNTKIRIKDEQHSVEVQSALFRSRGYWFASMLNQSIARQKTYLFVDDRYQITWGDQISDFNKSSNLEIQYNKTTKSLEHSKESHPHADLLMKYAEISMTDPEPWNHFEYYSDLLKKWCQMRAGDNLFRTDYYYRLKKAFKKINGHKIPNITFTPKNNEEFIVPALNDYGCRSRFVNSESEWFSYYLKNDMCYPNTEEGEAAAILHTKALMDYAE